MLDLHCGGKVVIMLLHVTAASFSSRFLDHLLRPLQQVPSARMKGRWYILLMVLYGQEELQGHNNLSCGFPL